MHSAKKIDDPLIIIVTIFLAVLTLQLRLPFFSFPRGGSWNDLVPVTLAVLAIAYGWFLYKKIELNKQVVQVCGAATALLLFATGATSYGTINVSAILLYLVAIWSIPLLTYLLEGLRAHIFLLSIVALLALQTQWALAQFVIQKDLGFYLLGESRLTTDISGVAKFAAGDDKLIRAYGPYPHSNPFAGSILIGLILLTPLAVTSFQYSRSKEAVLPFYGLLFVLVIGILIAFSRAVYFGLLLWTILFIIMLYKARLFHRHKSLLLLLLLTVLIFFPLLSARSSDEEDRAAIERSAGLMWAVSIVKNQNVLQGSGPGNYVLSLQDYLDSQNIKVKPWEIQPVHSVPVLLLAELGVVVGLAFIGFVIYQLAWHHSWRFIVPMLPVLLLDHYLYTQLVPLTLGIILILANRHLVYTTGTWRGRHQLRLKIRT